VDNVNFAYDRGGLRPWSTPTTTRATWPRYPLDMDLALDVGGPG